MRRSWVFQDRNTSPTRTNRGFALGLLQAQGLVVVGGFFFPEREQNASFLDFPGQDHFTNYTRTNRGFALGLLQAQGLVVGGGRFFSPEREQN
jgi:ribosomal protein L13E